MLAGQKLIARGDVDRPVHAPEDTVTRPLVANDELAAPVEKVRVMRRHEGVVRKDDLPGAPYDVLLGIELVTEPLDAVASDQDELGLARHLQLAEELGTNGEDFGGNRRSASPAELVPKGHGCRARPADVVLGLFHQLLRVGIVTRVRRLARQGPRPRRRTRETKIAPIRRVGQRLRRARRPRVPMATCGA